MGQEKYLTTGFLWNTKWRTLVSHLGPKGFFFSVHILPLDTSWHNTRAVAALQENLKKKIWNKQQFLCISAMLRLTDMGARRPLVMTTCSQWKKISLWVVIGVQCRSTTSQPSGRSTQLEGDRWTAGSAGGNWTWVCRASGEGFGCSAWADATVSSIWKSAEPVSFPRGHVHRALLALEVTPPAPGPGDSCTVQLWFRISAGFKHQVGG